MVARVLILLFALLPLLVGRAEIVQHLCEGKVIELAACCCGEEDRQPGVTMPDTCCHDEARSMVTPGMPASWPDRSPPALVDVAFRVTLVPMVLPPVPSEVPGQGFALHERGPPPPRTPLFLRIRTLLV